MRFKNRQVRQLLIGAVAGIAEALSNQDSYNCFDAPTKLNHNRMCNIGDRINVNLPEGSIFVRVRGWTNDGAFRCCKSQDAVGMVMAKMSPEMLDVWPQWRNPGFRSEINCLGGC
ncbi:hypothetical protein P153DRAFT_390711 [Dothidotthia symphoricarpi CBS 119687]|uniref:Uncharacterized protein n=1 Tax=Dothidotthia symphoricarpi CBS 119687 TaxID=1392245 RepID=A0A6A5ZZ44_9PLEO|nr:uncharacterized protein P153DRAFT_390711 [Dothidotthia symphoricarpi CBS 119687]KAF2124164.1 hypothetical protein P153DRAFT_390711 [Dothidotthia symphoricarpi CBS 119687]